MFAAGPARINRPRHRHLRGQDAAGNGCSPLERSDRHCNSGYGTITVSRRNNDSGISLTGHASIINVLVTAAAAGPGIPEKFVTADYRGSDDGASNFRAPWSREQRRTRTDKDVENPLEAN